MTTTLAADVLMTATTAAAFGVGLITTESLFALITRSRPSMGFKQGDRVRLTAFHRTQDHRGVVVALNVADVLEVAGYVTGSPDVRCRFLGRPNRTVIVPVSKVVRCVERAEVGQ